MKLYRVNQPFAARSNDRLVTIIRTARDVHSVRLHDGEPLRGWEGDFDTFAVHVDHLVEVVPMRESFRALYRAARADKLTGEALYRRAETLGLDRAVTVLLHMAVEKAMRPARTRAEDQADLLNCFSRGRNPWSAPSMTSPRFEGWRRQTCRVDALRGRLLARGMVVRPYAHCQQVSGLVA